MGSSPVWVTRVNKCSFCRGAEFRGGTTEVSIDGCTVCDLRGSPKVAVDHRASAKGTWCLEEEWMGPNDGKGQKANLPESLAGLGARVAVSTKGSGIESSKVDARRSSRAAIGIDGEHTPAGLLERAFVFP